MLFFFEISHKSLFNSELVTILFGKMFLKKGKNAFVILNEKAG